VIFLDTHVAAWLYAGEVERLPHSVRSLLERTDLAISPIVALELQYLFEIGRLSEPPEPVLTKLRRVLGLRVADGPLAEIVQVATQMTWTRDPFDRLIAAQARNDGVPLVTGDATIRRNYELAVWAD
jgi:PIN domain nuclease of toxin-antitoxin system